MMDAKKIVALAAVAMALTGCGYRASTLMPSDVRSVHIDMFDNATFRHEIEIPLTESVKNEVVRLTDLEIKPRADADSVLKGTITRVIASVAAYNDRDQIFTQDVTVYVRFEWRRTGTDELIAGSSSVAATGKLIAPEGDSQFTATAEAFRDVAQLIVQQMQQGF